MKIKKADIEDINGLAQLFDAYRVFYRKESDVSGATAFLKERIAAGESEVFIAVDHEGSQKGFVQLYPLFSSTRMKRLWLLNDLYVEPGSRGQGISKLLIDEAKNLCRHSGSCGMMLETAKSNMIGNKLYPLTGFELDEDHNYYSWDTQ